MKKRKKKKNKQVYYHSYFSIFICTIIICICCLLGAKAKYNKNKEYISQIEDMNKKIQLEEIEKEELNKQLQYIETEDFIIDTAKEYYGLVFPDEIVIKPKE